MTNTENKQWYDSRIELLTQFMKEERYQTLNRVARQRTNYMTILAENTFHPQNASALMRHCEAFGLQHMHTVETTCEFRPNSAIVRGTDLWVDRSHHSSSPQAITALRAKGYRIVVTTPHRQSSTPESFDVENGPFALVFGTEHAGVSDYMMEQADEYLRIPMCGMVESLNVSASAAILIYMLSERLRLSNAHWQLNDEELSELIYRWMSQSVKDSRQILNRKMGDPL